ncbi:MAG: hypothetical protein E7655_03350 [Ruminococcaceae bacterium]|nr:hypothetical protein [Oscillospiraceae bacterium]
MKRALLLLLTFPLIAMVAACSPADPADGSAPAAEESTAPDTAAAPDTTAAPVEEDPFDVPSDMEGIRKKTIDYFNAMSEVKWIAPETMDYKDDCPWTTTLVYEKGQAYYGLPYSTYRAGVSLAEFEDYLDDKSVYKGPLEYRELIGGDCGSMRRAWAYGGALCGFGMQGKDFQMIPGFSRPGNKIATTKVGHYDDSQFSSSTPTFNNINEVNGTEVMYEAYAQLKACDIIAYRFTLSTNGQIAQHIRMIVDDATVFRLNNGKIAPSRSYITFSEQTSSIRTIDGKKTTWVLNEVMSFTDLYNKGCIPLRLISMEKDAPDPVDMTATGFSKPENFASSPVLKGTIKCNYNIFETEITITDQSGNVVSHAKVYPYDLQVMLSEIQLSTPVKELPAGNYHFKTTATIGFGEKTVAEFDFTK